MNALAKLFVVLAVVTTGGLILATEQPQLETFVFHPDQFGKELVPRRQNPEELIRFIEERITRTTEPDAIRQIEKIIDFYDLQETASFFGRFLDQSEAQPDDILRSILFVRIVARIGLPPEREFARRYFQFLIPKATTTTMFEELALTYEAIGTGADPAPLIAAIARKAGSLDKADPQSVHEAEKLNQLGNFIVPRTTLFNQEKDRLANLPLRPARMDREIDLYLGLRPSFPGMSTFAARRLRHEVWSDQPPQQIYRADSARRREELVAAFRAAVDRVKAPADLPASAKTAMLIACYRAIHFFGGELSESEKDQLRSAGRQFNILSND
jgi:hypothetical protein